MKQLFSKWTVSVKEQENKGSKGTENLGGFLTSQREMVSEAGTKAVKVDGTISWMARLRCSRTLWNTILQPTPYHQGDSKQRINSNKVLYQEWKDTRLKTGNRALGSLQIPNLQPSRQGFATYAFHPERSVTWVSNSNACRTLLWTSLFHQWLQCKEVVAQIPHGVRSSWTQPLGTSLPYHNSSSLKWVRWRKLQRAQISLSQRYCATFQF